MKVDNVHERRLGASPAEVGALIDSLASHRDLLWPRDMWPRMEFDRPLAVGATGGHKPIRYSIETYQPGQSIRFRFLGPKGFDGFHGYEILPAGDGAILRHTLEMQTYGLALVTWPLMFGPMHDALLEDSLARAEASVGLTPTVRRWSPWVKLLRWAFTGGKARKQVMPNTYA
ncbi:MAG: SRPBCC family protein [Bacteroidota bacterium]